jgi:hypothetical protein
VRRRRCRTCPKGSHKSSIAGRLRPVRDTAFSASRGCLCPARPSMPAAVFFPSRPPPLHCPRGIFHHHKKDARAGRWEPPGSTSREMPDAARSSTSLCCQPLGGEGKTTRGSVGAQSHCAPWGGDFTLPPLPPAKSGVVM